MGYGEEISIFFAHWFLWFLKATYISMHAMIPGDMLGEPNENIIQNHLNIALLNVF